MRARSLFVGSVLFVGLITPRDAGAQTKAKDPCGFVTRKNAERCLGTLLVGASSAEDAVTLDDHAVGKGSVLLRNVPAGRHVVRVQKPGGEEVRREIVLAGGGVSVVKPSGAAFTGPSAAPLSQGSGGFFDECDGTYLATHGGRTFPLRPRDLVELRKKPALATHLPTAAALLAQPEDACRRDDAAACLEAARAWEQTIGKRESNLAKAHGFFEKGCALDNTEACVSFGVSLEGGYGGPADLAKAEKAFAKACSADHAEGCRRLGGVLAYPRAPLTPKSAAAGLPFMTRACELGDRLGCDFAVLLQRQISCARGDHEACELAGVKASPRAHGEQGASPH